jgi:hypothetical protein
MNNPKDVPASVVRDDSVDSIDFRTSVIPIGVRLENKAEDAGRLALSRDDWRILFLLLTKNIGGVRAVDESNSLQLLARLAGAAVRWCDRTKLECRPQIVDPWVEKPTYDDDDVSTEGV